MSARVHVLVALLLLTGCGAARRSRIDLPFRVRQPLRGQDGALDDRPLAGASRLRTWVERRDGERVDGSERDVTLPTSTFSLAPAPFGEDLVLRVDVLVGDTLLARGRSFPFDVTARGPSETPDVFVSSLGRFARRLAETAGGHVLAALPTQNGAILARADGALVRFSPAATIPFETLAARIEADARVAVVGERYLAAFSASMKSLVLVGPDGTLERTLTHAALERHGTGAMVAASPQGDALVIVGGLADAQGEDAMSVTRVDVPEDVGAVSAHPLASLPSTRSSGYAVWVEGSSPENARVLVLGGLGSAAGTALLVDPRGAGSATALPGVDVTNATPIALTGGQVLLVGGAAGNDVRLLVVTASPPGLVLAAPAPPPLSVARSAPALVRFAPEVVLVLGGTSGGGLVRSAELVDMREFPGETVQTGQLPSAITQPFAAYLRDGSAWLLDASGTFAYVPPRGQ